MKWFKRKKRTIIATDLSKTTLKKIDYPPKIILAWSKAIEGNNKLMFWLKENGYEELAMATFAIYLKDEARSWLQNNGYAHLLAMIDHISEEQSDPLLAGQVNNVLVAPLNDDASVLFKMSILFLWVISFAIPIVLFSFLDTDWIYPVFDWI